MAQVNEAAALRFAFAPAAARYFNMFSLLVFALYEGKNKQRYKDKYRSAEGEIPKAGATAKVAKVVIK